MNSKQITILVIDDDLLSVSALLMDLKDAGFNTLSLASGKAALQQAEIIRPDLILLDVQMPRIDGFETCRRLKKQDAIKEIPVIFMTSYTDILNKLKGFKVGGVDYITKPFHHEEVVARVNTHLMIRKQQQQLQTQNERLREQKALIEQQHEQLVELNACKDKFISIISHDLRSPFAGIFVLAEQITRDVKSQRHDRLQTAAGQLQNSMEKYHALLENLLTWAKVQQGILDYRPQPLDLYFILAKNFALFTSNARQKQVYLTHSIQERTGMWADLNMLDTIIRNLISNAIKFTNAGGRVEVLAAQNENKINISVSDTGTGIESEKLPQLFRIDSKFQRSGTSGEQGAGLGLLLCKEFVEKHGGTIWATSETGNGSTFTFTLPKQPLE